MECKHITKKSIQENGKTIGFRCILCYEFITMDDAFPHLRKRRKKDDRCKYCGLITRKAGE